MDRCNDLTEYLLVGDKKSIVRNKMRVHVDDGRNKMFAVVLYPSKQPSPLMERVEEESGEREEKGGGGEREGDYLINGF